jgi:tyrosinase
MNLDRNRAALAQRIYALFSANDNYTTFSNNVDGSYLDSVESIHDTIHTLVGGYGNDSDPTHPGHMSFTQWSAFDPIFLLHHCNIDRIFAIWQALHPDSWVEPGVSILGTYTTPKGGIVDSTTPLTPFYETANGSFWTSDSVRDHTKFGYTYAELILSSSSSNSSSNSNNRLALARSTKKAVNRKYGSFSPASVFLRELRSRGVRQEDGDTDKPASLSSLLAKRLPGKKTKNLPRSPLGSKLFAASTDGSGINYHEWTAHVIVGQQAVDQTGTVSLYLPNEAVNGKSNNPRDWPAESFVGTMGVFTTARQQQHPEQGQHPWAQQHANPDTKSPHAVPVSGTVPLTATLMDKLASGRLESLEPEHVVPYLREALRIAVQRPTGEVVSAQLESREAGCGVPGLEIRVLSAVVEAPWSEDELPKWGERRVELVVC